ERSAFAESLILSTVTRSRVKCTSHPSTNAGSPSFTGGNGYPVSASTSPEAAKRMPPGPGSAGAVNDRRPPSVTAGPSIASAPSFVVGASLAPPSAEAVALSSPEHAHTSAVPVAASTPHRIVFIMIFLVVVAGRYGGSVQENV